VDIALVSPVAVGDQLLVHAGTAIARLQGSA
jgi:hydrogenase maturation factor